MDMIGVADPDGSDSKPRGEGPKRRVVFLKTPC